MFTGIVLATAPVAAVDPLGPEGRRLAVRWPAGLARPRAGESVAVDGVCLTALAGRGRLVRFDVSPETLGRTTLGDLRPGADVHLEPALALGDPLGGHLLTGHVDGVGHVRKVAPAGEDFRRLEIEIPPEILPLVAVKGSLGVDGVSLTVNAVRGRRVSFMVVPHTLRVTRLGRYGPGTRVNLEADLLARYVEAALRARIGPAKGGRPRRGP